MTSSSDSSTDATREGMAPDTSAPTGDSAGSPATPTRKIGHYTIQGTIATGGMGTVYKAVQENPRRTVAIKIMKAGIASRSALRRFEFESQLLGRLRHPGIAQIFEAGTHEDDSGTLPFFAMEYIPNAKPITAYAREKKLGTRDQLELFAGVCDAVHHGHQKGIVHRDLKPTNILVGPNGEPKVIDFGVARATDSDMALTEMQTDVGQLVGTVQYMSPEQCEADPNDIDIRSDVYALGVTLYELLCGRLPYGIEKAPVFEATRMIRESNPTRPSTIDAKLRGDVETIVLKALEKDRERRYQSAAELARDLRHYLAGEAIMARPASVTYQLRVFARRNKPVVAGVAAVLVVAIVSAAAIAWITIRAERDRLLAERESLRAEQESMRAEQERLRADQASQQFTAARSYLDDIMSSLDPVRHGEQVRVSELLDRYGDSIGERFANQPLTEARVRMSLAQRYLLLNLMQRTERSDHHWNLAITHVDRAIEVYRDELGADDPQTLGAMDQLATFLGYGHDLERAEQLRREILEIRRGAIGEEDPLTTEAMSNLASVLVDRDKLDEAEQLARRALEHARLRAGNDDPVTTELRIDLARVCQQRGALGEAESLCREAVASHEDERSSSTLMYWNTISALANVLVEQGNIDEARALYGGSIVPDDLGLEEWLHGHATPTRSGPMVIIFWESWCPFSHVSLPQVSSRAARFSPDELLVVGLVELTRGTTEDDVLEFIRAHDLQFPSAKYDGKLADRFWDSVPHAVATWDGHIVWNGHPATISSGFLDGLVRASGDATRH